MHKIFIISVLGFAIGLFLFIVIFAVPVSAAQNPYYPSPSRCAGADWFIGAPDGAVCTGSILTGGTGAALENDPKANMIIGHSRLKPDLVSLNKFCQQYTGENRSYAAYGRMHNFCSACNQNLSWWNSNSWITNTACAGTINVQQVRCATNCGPVCTFRASKKCVGSAVYWFDSCNNQQDLAQTCSANQICQNAQCLNVTCNSNLDCGTNGFIGDPFCQGNNVYRNFKTYICNNPGTANSSCSSSVTSQEIAECGSAGCSNGQCLIPSLKVFCSASPNPANVNQLVTFNSVVYGGSGSYNYKWAYSCSGSQNTCVNSFANPGNYFAYLTVTSGSQIADAYCFVNVKQTCQPNFYKACFDRDVYWYDSCGNRQELYQDCGSLTCGNGQCVNPQNPLIVSVTASPNPANINQLVTFTPSISGGVGNYLYNWSGICTGSSQTCQKSFSTPGNYTAYLTVTSRTQSATANSTVSIQQTCQPNSYKTCFNNDVWWYDSCGNKQEKAEECGQNTCQNGQCVIINPPLYISATAFPNPANVNQLVTFSANVSGGTGSYTYNWTGACQGNNQTCQRTFYSTGNYTAYLTVVSGSETKSASTSVSVQRQCNPNSYKACFGGDVYWFDSCGSRQELYQDCGSSTCSNGQCQTPVCTPNSYKGCYGRNVYWFDSCQNRQELAEDCGWGTCQNGRCILNSFSVSCNANPNPASVNQTVTFNSYILLPTNNSARAIPLLRNPFYYYSWSGACSGSSNICSNSFAGSGMYTANLRVTIGNITKTTSCQANIQPLAYPGYNYYPNYGSSSPNYNYYRYYNYR